MCVVIKDFTVFKFVSCKIRQIHLLSQLHGGAILELIRACQKEVVMSCINIQFCMQSEGYSDLNTLISALISSNVIDMKFYQLIDIFFDSIPYAVTCS